MYTHLGCFGARGEAEGSEKGIKLSRNPPFSMKPQGFYPTTLETWGITCNHWSPMVKIFEVRLPPRLGSGNIPPRLWRKMIVVAVGVREGSFGTQKGYKRQGKMWMYSLGGICERNSLYTKRCRYGTLIDEDKECGGSQNDNKKGRWMLHRQTAHSRASTTVQLIDLVHSLGPVYTSNNTLPKSGPRHRVFLPHILCGPPSSVSCMVSCIPSLFVPSSMVVGWFYTFSFFHKPLCTCSGKWQCKVYSSSKIWTIIQKTTFTWLHRIMRESEMSPACHISLTIPCQSRVPPSPH